MNETTREEVREHRLQPIIIPPPLGEPVYHRNAPRRVKQRQTRNDAVALPTVVLDDIFERRRRRTKRCGGRCRFCGVIFLFFALSISWFVLDSYDSLYFLRNNNNLSVNPIKINNDYSSVKSISELSTDSVDPWCAEKFKSKICTCQDPLIPEARASTWNWEELHQANIQAAKSKKGQVDVVFLGDSITEGWLGMNFGQESSRAYGAPKVFRSLFSIEDGGKYEGLPLGISADATPNLLQRIQTGEIPDSLNPSVFWVLIGTNDLGNTWCSAELVVIGVIRIVEEIRQRKPDATVVVNGLLPRTFHRRGFVKRGRRTWLGFGEALPSLWDDICAINAELKNYASQRDKVEYFETNVFFKDTSVPAEQLRINRSLMTDFLHPSAHGYKLWGSEIVAFLQKLKPKQN